VLSVIMPVGEDGGPMSVSVTVTVTFVDPPSARGFAVGLTATVVARFVVGATPWTLTSSRCRNSASSRKENWMVVTLLVAVAVNDDWTEGWAGMFVSEAITWPSQDTLKSLGVPGSLASHQLNVYWAPATVERVWDRVPSDPNGPSWA